MQQVCRQTPPPHLSDTVVKAANTTSDAVRGVNKTRAMSRAEAGSSSRSQAHEPRRIPVPENTSESETVGLTSRISSGVTAAAATDWATMSSTRCHNRFVALLVGSDGDAGADADDRSFVTVARRGSKYVLKVLMLRDLKEICAHLLRSYLSV